MRKKSAAILEFPATEGQGGVEVARRYCLHCDLHERAAKALSEGFPADEAIRQVMTVAAELVGAIEDETDRAVVARGIAAAFESAVEDEAARRAEQNG